jgi:p-cumate 2,3-dioxygenase subunit alpha
MPINLEDIIANNSVDGSFKVDRRAYVDDSIATLEQQRIFARCWLYAGHESEIATPGSFVTRSVCGRPVILTRGPDNRLRTFANSCPHRGAHVCRESSGTSNTFRCPYHSWTFSNQGNLIAVPSQEAYPKSFQTKDYGLMQHRTESYRGFIFIALEQAEVPPLTEYLAGAREYLDLIVDQSEVGMELLRGTQLHGAKANWKLMIENSLDLYHFRSLHERYVDYMETLGTQSPRHRGGIARALGNGHAVNELAPAAARPIAYWTPMFPLSVKPDIEAKKRQLAERLGTERADRIATTNRALLIFPNLMVIDSMAITIRKIEPIQANTMSITSWALAPIDETPKVRELRLSHYLTFLGPGGFATPDDVEIVESCQAGYANTLGRHSNLSRGMHKAHPETTDELPVRSFWERWHFLMTMPVEAVARVQFTQGVHL